MVAAWLADGQPRREQLADELGDVAYYWAELSVRTGVPPSTLLARSRAHTEWRQAGRPAGGPAPAVAAITLEDYAAWAVGAAAGSGDRPDARALSDVALALVGDAGEVIECLRLLARDKDRPRDRLAGELGDVWRYWARLAVATGLSPAALLVRSRARIAARRAGPAQPTDGCRADPT